MKDLIEHNRSILQIKSPLPFPLRWVNSYIIRGSKGCTLIDPGLHTEESKANWLRVLKEQNIDFRDIEKIVLTHHHPDHYGLSGWFQEKTNAPVFMSEKAYGQAVRLWGEDTTINHDLIALFVKHGMSTETADLMLPHLESFIPLVSPQPKVDCLIPGGSITLGDSEYLMIAADGHAAGQLCFYNQEHEEMFCGDQVLPRITPNISYLPGGDANPLDTFLSSLQDIQRYSVKKAYPGHRDPFQAFAERTQEIIQHHQERLQAILDMLETPRSAYEVCSTMFGDRLSIHQLRFAMAETLAHTSYLLRQNKVEEHIEAACIVYRRNK